MEKKYGTNGGSLPKAELAGQAPGEILYAVSHFGREHGGRCDTPVRRLASAQCGAVGS